MKNAVLGLFIGVLLTSAVWWSASILRTPSRAQADGRSLARMPAEYDRMHESLAPGAQQSIEAFKAIASALAEGKLAGVREHALAIAEFFAPMNANIESSARRLSTARDLDTAKTLFRDLTEAFQHPPINGSEPDSYEL